jgi:hypothetical protein
VILHGISHVAADGISSDPVVHMELLAEPQTHVYEYMGSISCPDLEDDKHLPIQVAVQGRTVFPMGAGGMVFERGKAYRLGVSGDEPASATMTVAENHGRRIPLFRGSIEARMTGQKQTLNIPTLPDEQSFEIAGLNVQVRVSKRNAETYDVAVRYTRLTMDAARWAQLQKAMGGGELKVAAADDAPLSVTTSPWPSFLPPPGTTGPTAGGIPGGFIGGMGGGFGGGFGGLMQGQSDLQVEVHYWASSANGKVPHHATLEVPIDVQVVQVPFQFTDVILP